MYRRFSRDYSGDIAPPVRIWASPVRRIAPLFSECPFCKYDKKENWFDWIRFDVHAEAILERIIHNAI